ncbi:MAG: HAD-IA family hydrolase, partial [Candidatus Omnitrophota bacterium]|nr:HAD-IA family hydrolase [Candidatus Omnitrophota bacterium]
NPCRIIRRTNAEFLRRFCVTFCVSSAIKFDFFDYALCADQTRYGKPHPEMLNKIVKRFFLKKSQTLYVGDMVIDVQAGRRAKINTVIVTSGSSNKLDIKREHPFRIISAISRLRDLL